MEIAVSGEVPEDVEADVLAFPVAEPVELPDAGRRLDERLSGKLAHLIEDGELKGSSGTVTLVHTLGELRAHRVAAVGLGKRARVDADSLRTAAARVAARAGTVGGGAIAWSLDGELPLSAGEQARAVVEGTILGAYDAARWKTNDDKRAPINRLLLCGTGAEDAGDQAHRAGIVAGWANRCRDLVNAPANELTPARLAEEAAEAVGDLEHVRCETLSPEQIAAAGMEALAAVARGSEMPACLIVLRYEPPQPRGDGLTLGLVGKAITFDSGGISIKPSGRMEDMKSDMAGGAAAVCGFGAIAETGLPLRVLAVVPATENMLSGRATRPGDIITAKNGKTIEITNTDAEGRLVLADSLVFAREEGATHLLDLATLTGAMVVAMGDFYAGLFGNDEAWTAEVRSAAESSGDHAWPFPLHETYKRLYRSTFADMTNSSDLRQAGPIYAASFLQEFVSEGTPWAHLDIAGTACLDRGRGDYYTAKGATGYGVRLIAELAHRLARPPT